MSIESKSFSQQKYTSLHPLRRFLIHRFLAKVFAEIEKEKHGSILDIGCGEGQADKFFLRRDPSLQIVGLDVNSKALKEAKINCPQMKTKKANVYQLPFPTNSFDLVLCLEVLEHLEDPEETLRQIKKIGRNRAIITVPNEPLFSLASFLSGKYLKNLGRHPDHVQFWSKKKFEGLLNKHFLKTEVTTAFPWLIGIVDLKRP